MSIQEKQKGASREDLFILHRLVLDACLAYMRDVPVHEMTGFMLSVIRAFLRDNNIRCDLTQLKDIKSSLEDLREFDLPFSLPLAH
jgi:hypothetical protein